MDNQHRTFLDTLWPERDDRWSNLSAPFQPHPFRDGFSTALGEAQGRLDTMTTQERVRLAWAILRGRG